MALDSFNMAPTAALLLALACLVSAQQETWTEDQNLLQKLVERFEEQEETNIQLKEHLNALQKRIEAIGYLASNLVTGGAKDGIFRTCEEIRRANSSSLSGTYTIDPDGQGLGAAPITVYCDMATGSTSVFHDSEGLIEADRCLEPGCYTRLVNYYATYGQMLALIQQSTSCSQTIQFDCVGVPLEYGGVQQAWWKDRNGENQIYWAGSNSSYHTCQCGLDRNCNDPAYRCNCDASALFSLSDIGAITNKDHLPITQLNFGRTLSPSTYGRHKLGRLECRGRDVDDRMPESCQDLWQLGYTVNGIFSVKGQSEVLSVYCNFSVYYTDPAMQTLIGSVDVKSTPVYFYVQRNSSFSTLTTIPFEIEVVNIGGAMDLLSGVFTAPVPGVYSFVFTATRSSVAQNLEVAFLLNNVTTATGYAFVGAGNFPVVSLPVTLELRAQDRVSLQLVTGAIYERSNVTHFTHFTGALVQENFNFP